jgi:protein-S-isoprenylcysteine O-methyltransferase Ste14
VSESDLMPPLFRAADAASLAGQALTVRLARLQLVLLTGAALFATLPQWHWSVAVAGALLVMAMWYALRNHREAPQAAWYEGRAVAESIKTLVWKYSVGADRPDPDALYDTQLSALLHTFRDKGVLPHDAEPEITAGMRNLRAAPLAVRQEVYVRDRVTAQHDWYTAKAARCARLGRINGRLTWILPSLGVSSAVLTLTGWLSPHLVGAAAAATASLTAWAQLRQYRPLATAYRLTADELGLVRAQLASIDPSAPGAEELWSRLARDAEDAVSREHTTWQARREPTAS